MMPSEMEEVAAGLAEALRRKFSREPARELALLARRLVVLLEAPAASRHGARHLRPPRPSPHLDRTSQG
jgi:hypothetical protein